MKKIRLLTLTFLLLILFATQTFSQKIVNGEIKFDPAKTANGATVDLTGNWFYRPDYAIKTGEKIESSPVSKDDFAVGVPQFLNQIRWWLDDSEDFKKAEAARMKRLGFDTDKVEEGWYKLTIDAAAIPADKRVFIEFDGVAMKSKVFLNGTELGPHTGMFSRFAFDLTPHLKPGKNLLAVWVSMEKIPVSTASLGTAVTVNLTASKVLSLSKGMFGPMTPVDDNRAYDMHGIWQPVRLAVYGTATLDDVYFVPTLTGARVNIEAKSLGASQTANVKAKWTDVKTNKVFAETKPQKITLNQTVSNTALEVSNLQPKLWTPADPNLYRLEVTLESNDGKVLDKYEQNVGFRTFEARGNKLYLNGKPYWLRGANHLPYGKNPWDINNARRLIQAMHDNNQAVTRTHATPWSKAWLDLADEIGLGVSVEGIRPWAFVGKIGVTPQDLFDHWLMENADVIKRIRNHPSVLIWTIGNEMLLRDNENPDKWKQLSDVVKQTRALDATRPTVVSSYYQRDTELYEKVIAPNKIDDGDIDDLHSYKGWYADSPFVSDSKFEKEMEKSKWNRPFIGQEMSTGYPNLEDGLPAFTYVKNQRSPQAWVGVHSYPGSNPAVFLEHHRAVTKRWAEQLRFQRGDKTAGFMLFANECWFQGSYGAPQVVAYPVVEAIKYAFAPVGVALETAQRRFYTGDAIKTNVFVTNDDEKFLDYQNLQIEFSFVDQNGKQIAANKSGNVTGLKYYATAQIPAEIKVPNMVKTRTKYSLVTRLLNGMTEISRTVDLVEVFPQPTTNKISTSVAALALGAEMSKLTREKFQTVGQDMTSQVVLVGKDAPLNDLKTGGKLYGAAQNGATVVVFSPGKKLQEIFPNDVAAFRKVSGEYADWTPANGTKLVQNLELMDLKWWARTNDWRVMVASEAHRLKPGGRGRELIRFVPAHGYIALDRVNEYMMTTLFEIPVGKGRVWVCDFDLEESIAIDPAARMFAENLLTTAADANSTKNLIQMPTHEEMLAGKRPPTK